MNWHGKVNEEANKTAKEAKKTAGLMHFKCS
jgi:hypothetical protein